MSIYTKLLAAIQRIQIHLSEHRRRTDNPHQTLLNVTNDAQLKRADGDFATFAEKTSLVSADKFIIEDSAASGAKKYVQVTNLPGGADPTAIHTDVEEEIYNIFGVTPEAEDVLVIESSIDSWAKKSVEFRNIPHEIIANVGSYSHEDIDHHIDNYNGANPHGVQHSELADGPWTYDHSDIDDHIGDTDNPHSVTKAQVGLTDVTDDAQLKRAANDFSSFSEKTSLVSADKFLIEDSAASGAKKYVQVTNLPGGTDTNAVHKNVAAEISTITEKAVPISADLLVIEDSADSNNKKRVQIGNLPGGSGTDANAIHVNAEDEIHSIATATPAAADVIVFEDANGSTTWEKKSAAISAISHTLLADVGSNAHSTIDTHLGSTSNPHGVTKAQVSLSNVTDDAQLKRADNDWTTFSEDGSPLATDWVLTEKASGGTKGKIQAGSLVATDGGAIHKAVAGEISAITAKASPAINDYLLAEDSADSNNKKAIQIGDLPGGISAVQQDMILVAWAYNA